jgi:hypothetical protein
MGLAFTVACLNDGLESTAIHIAPHHLETLTIAEIELPAPVIYGDLFWGVYLTTWYNGANILTFKITRIHLSVTCSNRSYACPVKSPTRMIDHNAI